MSVHPAAREVLPSKEEKAAAVRRMFGAIAPRYDLLNHLLSLNIDKRWRRRAIDLLRADLDPGGRYLDACAGTLDLALELAGRSWFAGKVFASDFTFEMLERGQHKIGEHPVVTTCADALQLPFPDESFTGATVGFGVRNLADLDRGLREFVRVLRPGGRLVILEFSTPQWTPFRQLYLFYFLRVLPLVGRLISRHSRAYDYLPASVLEFPEPPELGRRMEEAGFESVEWHSLTGGIATIHVGVRR